VASGIDAAIDYYDSEGDATIPVRVLFGTGAGFEVGANYTSLSHANSWNVNAKYVTPLALAGAQLAVGGQYSSLDYDDITVFTAYLVGDIPVGETAKFSLGVNWSSFTNGPDTDAFRFFAGFNATIAEKVGVVADLQTQNQSLESDMLYSVAVRYAFTPNISGQLGYTDAWGAVPMLGTHEGNLFAGVNFTFNTTE
jgi:hypothetical protein